jgi:hypothetical protein
MRARVRCTPRQATQRARILSGDNVVLTRNALPLARQTPSRPYLWMISDQQTRFMAFPEIGDERYSMYAQPSA